MTTVKTPRAAQITASYVHVCCPYCGEQQPNSEGHELVSVYELEDEMQGMRDCVSCDETMRVSKPSKASLA